MEKLTTKRSTDVDRVAIGMVIGFLILWGLFIAIGISANDEYNKARHQICKDYGAADYDERMGACYKIQEGHRVRVYQLKEGQYTDLYSRWSDPSL